MKNILIIGCFVIHLLTFPHLLLSSEDNKINNSIKYSIDGGKTQLEFESFNSFIKSLRLEKLNSTGYKASIDNGKTWIKYDSYDLFIKSLRINVLSINKQITTLKNSRINNLQREKNFHINVYPSPGNLVSYHINSFLDGEAFVSIKDIFGIDCFNFKTYLKKGTNVFKLDFSNFLPGIYFSVVDFLNEKYSKSIVIR